MIRNCLKLGGWRLRVQAKNSPASYGKNTKLGRVGVGVLLKVLGRSLSNTSMSLKAELKGFPTVLNSYNTKIQAFCYLDSLIWGSREEQVSGGVDTQTPDGPLVAHERPLTLEDLLGVVRYTRAQRRVRLDVYFTLEAKHERSISEAKKRGQRREEETDVKEGEREEGRSSEREFAFLCKCLPPLREVKVMKRKRI